jgi:hypothetical protein
MSGLLLATPRAGAEPADADSTPVRVIFDTDVDQDCDDIGALFVLHGAVELGEVRLLATMGCTSSDAIAPCLDAINTWFGRPEIPVGTLKDRGFLAHTGFADELIQRYPHRFPAARITPTRSRSIAGFCRSSPTAASSSWRSVRCATWPICSGPARTTPARWTGGRWWRRR